jgi:hypothetical protein
MPLDSDPLTTLQQLAQQVAKTGIRRISGQVVVDASLFPEGERELGTRVTLSPMVVNDNVIDIVLTPGARAGDRVGVQVLPATSYLTVHANLVTTDSGAPALVRSTEDSTSSDRRVLVMNGAIPRGANVNARWAVASPRRFGEIVFTEVLNTLGVEAVARLGARATDARTFAAFYADSMMVAEHVSLPLTAEAVVLLKTSQNLHASNFPLLLPTTAQGTAGRTGFDMAREWLVREGLALAADYGRDWILIVRRLEEPAMLPAGFYPDEGGPLPPPVHWVRRYADGREEPLRGGSFSGVQRWLLRDIVAAGPQRSGAYLAAEGDSDARYGRQPASGLVTWLSAPDVLIGEVEVVPRSGDPDDLPAYPAPALASAPAPR